ncbi:MAG: sulfite exporter TauE/SafE family protein [Bacteroidetes bacterium]|nr:sulfite exporter TauE/SafE family protein [Bacteroidota bacterium]
MEWPILFYVLLFAIAFLYASVGHGGASGYIALMTLFSFSPDVIRPAALVMNVFVSGLSFYHFHRTGYFRKELFIPLAIASIPAAFIGGMMDVDAHIYKMLLGAILCIPIFTLSGLLKMGEREKKVDSSFIVLLLVGGIIGFFSGLIGIGGGIMLSPLILLFGWGKMKETAAVSALFILVNSLAGIFGQKMVGMQMDLNMGILAGVVMGGGFLGAYFGAAKWNKKVLERVLAFVLVIAVYKLIFTG